MWAGLFSKYQPPLLTNCNLVKHTHKQDDPHKRLMNNNKTNQAPPLNNNTDQHRPQNKLSTSAMRVGAKLPTWMLLYYRSNLLGCTGLAAVIRRSPHTHTPTHTRSRWPGRINICRECTLLQQCKIYVRLREFTLCLPNNSSVRPNY